MQIYCIMNSGSMLSNSGRTALFQAACDCALREKHEKKVYHDDVRGEVHTDYECFEMGGIAGIVFEGNIVTEAGESKVSFLIRATDIEEMKNDETADWIGYDELLERMNSYKNN